MELILCQSASAGHGACSVLWLINPVTFYWKNWIAPLPAGIHGNRFLVKAQSLCPLLPLGAGTPSGLNMCIPPGALSSVLPLLSLLPSFCIINPWALKGGVWWVLQGLLLFARFSVVSLCVNSHLLQGEASLRRAVWCSDPGVWQDAPRSHFTAVFL